MSIAPERTRVPSATAAELVVAASARLSRRLVAGAIVVAAAVALLPGTVPPALVLAVAGLGLVAGLPHGAVDHRVAARLTGRPVLQFHTNISS